MGGDSAHEPPHKQQLSADERVLQEVRFHHDKAGLAAAFRTRDASNQNVEVDFQEASDMTPATFRDRYVARNRPVVLLNAVTSGLGWGNSQLFTVEALRRSVGHAEVNVRCRPLQGQVFGDVAKFGEGFMKPYSYEKMTLGAFFESLDQEVPPYYAARLELQEHLPELVESIPSHFELPWRSAFGRPYKDGVISYLGAGQQKTPLHYDDVENMLFVLAGSKMVTLYPPSEAPFLYPAPQRLGTHYCIVPPAALDPASPQADAWPLVRKARGTTVTVPVGSALYLPCSWLHSVKGSSEFNMTANYWYAQSPAKMDLAARREHETQIMNKWVQQLSTMGLPASIMAEAYEEAPRLTAQKVAMHEQWDWNNVEESLRLTALN